jgi:hypothetical protein
MSVEHDYAPHFCLGQLPLPVFFVFSLSARSLVTHMTDVTDVIVPKLNLRREDALWAFSFLLPLGKHETGT